MSRTNIDLDDELVSAIMTRYRVRTKTEVVDLAMRHLVGQPMTVDEALLMHGQRAIADVPVDTGPV